jgi:hypothetical protein
VQLDPDRRKGWLTWPNWLLAYIATLFVIRDIVLTLLQK